MKKFLACLQVVCLMAPAFAADEYLGLYLQGQKIGYSHFSSKPATLNGQAVVQSDTRTTMNMEVLGTPMSVRMESSTWSAAGRPVKMRFLMESAGRTQKVDATFSGAKANVRVDNSGSITVKTLDVPKGGLVVDDPVALMTVGDLPAGARRVFYVLDPMTVTFIRNEVRLVGPRKTTVKGRVMASTLLEVIDPRAKMQVFLTAKGDLLRVLGPMGIEMLPEPKAVALGVRGDYAPTIDLAFANTVKTDRPIKDPATLTRLKLRLKKFDLSRMPSDVHQTVRRDGASWLLDIHPPKLDAAGAESISQAASERPAWVKPSLHMPSEDPTFKAQAAEIVGNRTNVVEAALAIKEYVHGMMKPNAGIGVLRDASEVLRTKEGVCRDYAILTGTLLRAAGIPTRLASGLVNWNGSFYYHAWNEVWDGTRWVGIDSTVKEAQLAANHVKLGHGNVEEAFTFTLLEGVEIEVLSARHD